RRRERAARYRAGLARAPVTVPPERDPGHVYHLFVVRSAARDALRAHLAAQGIETLVHYPIPLPEQPAFASVAPAVCPEAARACRELVSLPLHPALPLDTIDRIAGAVAAFTPATADRR
ncbi:MAG TPA: DegT/DnrJ/EryC1/StrS family aminotransferase, partial [Vicinamibacterales bacterium]|nr:DegT/DnrJ/EryC1/StrS family aminotransferase [Vicinamibacterales bacterium]